MKDHAMNATTPNYGVGVALCDGNISAIVRLPHRADDKVSNRVHRHESVQEALERCVFIRFGSFTPPVIGFSSHDSADVVEEIVPPGISRVIAISPTVATIAGLSSLSDPSTKRIQPGSTRKGRPSGLLKIGPQRLSTAIEGDLKPTFYSGDTIAGLCSKTQEVAEFLGGNVEDPLQFVGNPGWVNVAEMLASRDGAGIQPRDLTVQLLNTVAAAKKSSAGEARQYSRIFASHAYSLAVERDPFATEVAKYMLEIFSYTVAFTNRQQQAIGSLSVQCNWLSTHRGKLPWMGGTDAVTAAFTEAGLPGDLTVSLIGPNPQWAEASGAIDIATKLAAA
jgi:hypothetical protein